MKEINLHAALNIMLAVAVAVTIIISAIFHQWQEDRHSLELKYNELFLMVSMSKGCYGSFTTVATEGKLVCDETKAQSAARVTDIRKERQALAQKVGM